MCHPHSIFPCWFGFVLDHFWLIAAALLAAIVLGIALVRRWLKARRQGAAKAAPLAPHTRANKMLPWAIAICVGIAAWALWAESADGAVPIGAAPIPHPSCGEAPLLILNEDTGEIFPAIGATFEHSPAAGVRVLRFRDGRVFCNGYEAGSP